MVAPRTTGGAKPPKAILPAAKMYSSYQAKQAAEKLATPTIYSSYFAKQAADRIAAGTVKPPAPGPGPKPPKPPKTKKPAGTAKTLPSTTTMPAAQAAPAQVGLPGGVIRALSQYDVDRAALAVRARQADVARRNVFSQGLIGAGQMAADIYGGRSPAILGQAITGQQRQALVTAAEQAAQRQASELALQQALEGTLQQQYGMTSQRALEEAQRRGAMLSQIRAVGA